MQLATGLVRNFVPELVVASLPFDPKPCPALSPLLQVRGVDVDVLEQQGREGASSKKKEMKKRAAGAQDMEVEQQKVGSAGETGWTFIGLE